MDPGLLGIILLVSVAVVASAFLHRHYASRLRASLTAAGLASGILVIADTIHRGYPHKMAALAFVVGALVAFVIALPVGWLVRRFSRRADRDPEQP